MFHWLSLLPFILAAAWNQSSDCVMLVMRAICDLWRNCQKAFVGRLQEPCFRCCVCSCYTELDVTHNVRLTSSSVVKVVRARVLGCTFECGPPLWQKGSVMKALNRRKGPSTPWVMRAELNRLQVRSRGRGGPLKWKPTGTGAHLWPAASADTFAFN